MHRKYYENADECCYYIKQNTYQDMNYGVWAPHFRTNNRIVAYHNFSKNHMIPDTMYPTADGKKEPQNGDVCPICGRMVQIIEG